MSRITIVGSGIIGMSIAAMLARSHEVTIVAKNLPGDEPSIDWASPWAGAIFVAGPFSSSPREQQMQLDAFAVLWRWSASFPESSLRRVTLEDFHEEDVFEEAIWWKKYMPDFQLVPSHNLPKGVKVGISYQTVVLNPNIFLPWLKTRLENDGVKFSRMTLNALSDVQALNHEIIVNATEMVRGQTIVVRHSYKKVFMRDNGIDYTYVIPRMDGTVILGGIRQKGSCKAEVEVDISKDIIRRVHESLPDIFPQTLEEYDIIGYNVGIRPSRSSGIRVERETRDGENIVHAYGFGGGGYIYSFGAARVVRDLIEETLFPSMDVKF